MRKSASRLQNEHVLPQRKVHRLMHLEGLAQEFLGRKSGGMGIKAMSFRGEGPQRGETAGEGWSDGGVATVGESTEMPSSRRVLRAGVSAGMRAGQWARRVVPTACLRVRGNPSRRHPGSPSRFLRTQHKRTRDGYSTDSGTTHPTQRRGSGRSQMASNPNVTNDATEVKRTQKQGRRKTTTFPHPCSRRAFSSFSTTSSGRSFPALVVASIWGLVVPFPPGGGCVSHRQMHRRRGSKHCDSAGDIRRLGAVSIVRYR